MQYRVTFSDLGLDPEKARRIVSSGLAMFSGYFLKRVAGRFAAEGPGWPPRHADTAAAAVRDTKVKSLAEHRLKRKLERELRRATIRADRGKGTLLAVARKRAVLQEFNRQIAGGSVNTAKVKKRDKTMAAWFRGGAASRQLQKSVAGLQQRQQRAEKQASSKLLGRGGQSTYKKLSRGALEVGNKIPWWGAQEEGGAVGRGAKLPARPAYYVEDVDLEVLTEILINKALSALGS